MKKILSVVITLALGFSLFTFSYGSKSVNADETTTTLTSSTTAETLTDSWETQFPYKLSSQFCTGLSPVSDMIERLKTVHIPGVVTKVFDDNINEMNSGYIGTGMNIRIYKDDVLVKDIKSVVYGDCSGDGEISISDLLANKKAILNVKPLNDAYLVAANCDHSADGFNFLDMVLVKKYLLKICSINQNVLPVAVTPTTTCSTTQTATTSNPMVNHNVPYIGTITDQIKGPTNFTIYNSKQDYDNSVYKSYFSKTYDDSFFATKAIVVGYLYKPTPSYELSFGLGSSLKTEGSKLVLTVIRNDTLGSSQVSIQVIVECCCLLEVNKSDVIGINQFSCNYRQPIIR